MGGANLVLDYIRRNVSLDRVVEVEENIVDFVEFKKELMEIVYHGLTCSWKVTSSKARGIVFLRSILYLLTGEPKIEDWGIYRGDEIEVPKVECVLRTYFVKKGDFFRHATRLVKIRGSSQAKNKLQIIVHPYVFRMLDGEVFSYMLLRSLLKVIRKALDDPTYDYRPQMSWEEAITDHLVSELKVIEEIL
jgi:hypothetical protein